MFRCEICNKVSEPREPSVRIPVEFREVEYPAREYANRRDDQDDPRGTDDPGGVGIEIVKEKVVCEACAEAFLIVNK